jgi:hypothetical protein
MSDVRTQASQLASDNKILEAVALLQNAPKDWQVWHDLGVYCLSQGQMADAVDAFDQAAQSGEPIAKTSQAVMLLVAGKLPDAVSAVQQITTDAPDCAYAWQNYAALLWAAGKQKETAKAVAQLKELSSEPAQYQKAAVRTTHEKPFEVLIDSTGRVDYQKPAQPEMIRDRARRSHIPPEFSSTVDYLAERLDTTKEATIGDIRLRDKGGQWVLERYSPRGVEESLPISGATGIEYRSGAMSGGRRFMAIVSALLLIASVPARIHSWTLMGIFLGAFLLTLPFVAMNRPKRGFLLRYPLGQDEFVYSAYVFDSHEQAKRLEMEWIALSLLVKVLCQK